MRFTEKLTPTEELKEKTKRGKESLRMTQWIFHSHGSFNFCPTVEMKSFIFEKNGILQRIVYISESIFGSTKNWSINSS